MKKILSLIMSSAMVASAITIAPAVSASQADKTPVADSSFTTSVNADDFSWDNASVYFLLTDRFNNGNTSNDHSYDRGLEKDGSVTTDMKSDAASFQGGDFAGITKKINEGYFNDLGVNALWISAPYEQIQGYSCSGNGKSSFPHYSYHGYYAGDYSEIDQNFGTPEEFKTMVDTAHEKGLRVVLDIVMNHPGYNTMYDMNKFGFGMLKDGWDTNYYSFAGDNNTYHNYITYTNASQTEELSKLWGTWWGGSWMRAGISGYPAVGTDDLTGSAGGELPDFRTESEEEVEVPTFLQNKWKSEGSYDEKMADLEQWFTSTGNTKRVRNYLCYWLSSYVEEYGIDGFRCDTAKHVEKDSWAALKDTCVKALNTWRENNPTKAGANWDEDFWMTGEVYGKGLSNANDPYFAEGKFDSTINFAFSGGGGVSAVSSINETYKKYAENINTADNYNVLSYISSHDTKLCGRDKSTDSYSAEKLIYQGSALQLLPGGIQIFYGDETGRKYVKHSLSGVNTIITSGNHDVRSFMNWDSIDNEILTHWQKVGTFRNNHISVGAGAHKTLSSTSGAAFERYYDKNGIKDKVVACIGADADKNVTITVDSSDFPDGTLLKNTYDNTTAIVYKGKVTFNSGANGTILCEVAGTGEAVKVDSVTLSSTTASLYTGETVSLSATVTPENATAPTVTWSSSDETVATVDENGVVKGVKGGTAVITATADGVSSQCTVLVMQHVTDLKLNATSKTLYAGSSTTLKATVTPADATNKKVTWSSSNKAVATVDENGVVKGVKSGTAVITATADGVSSKCTVSVKQYVTGIKLNATSKTLYTDSSTTLKATVTPTNASNKKVTWKSSNTSVATVTQAGKVVAKKRGACTVTATSTDGSKKSAKCVITVKQKVTKVILNRKSVVLKEKGKSTYVKATVYPSNANVKTLAVKVKNTKIAKISASKIVSGKNLKVTAVKKGNTTITFTATDGSRKSATCTVKVQK